MFDRCPKTSRAAHEGASLATVHAIVSGAERCLVRTEGLFPGCNASCQKSFFCIARKYTHRKKTTLWQLAARHKPNADIAIAMDACKRHARKMAQGMQMRSTGKI
jgi:hypothetical protein